jgi:hypothetical protein
LPQINFDPFIFCPSGRSRVDGFVFTGLGIAFGKPRPFGFQRASTTGALIYLTPPHRVVADLLAFSIIFVRAKRHVGRFPGIPNLLDAILRGATIYFVIIFTCQLCLMLFLVFAPVSDACCVRGKVTLMCSLCAHVQPRIMFTPAM